MRVGSGQHKLQILGRFFQRLQHGVESRVGQHVHLVDHEDLEASLHWLVDRLLQQRLHFVHATVAGGVELGIVHKPAAINIRARLADSTRGSGDSAVAVHPLAIERLGQNARNRCFAHTTGAGEQIGMVQALGC